MHFLTLPPPHQLALQLVRYLAEGGRLAIPDRQSLPGKGSADFAGLDAFVAIIHRCWQQVPHERPSFEEIIDMLRCALGAGMLSVGWHLSVH